MLLKSKETQSARVNRTEFWKGNYAEGEPWRSVEIPFEYSGEYSVALTHEETS